MHGQLLVEPVEDALQGIPGVADLPDTGVLFLLPILQILQKVGNRVKLALSTMYYCQQVNTAMIINLLKSFLHSLFPTDQVVHGLLLINSIRS